MLVKTEVMPVPSRLRWLSIYFLHGALMGTAWHLLSIYRNLKVTVLWYFNIPYIYYFLFWYILRLPRNLFKNCIVFLQLKYVLFLYECRWTNVLKFLESVLTLVNFFVSRLPQKNYASLFWSTFQFVILNNIN